MKLTKQLKADLAKAYQCALDISILDMKAPLRYINQYIAEDVNGFGTAADEKVQSRAEFKKMVMDSRQQSKTMLFKPKKITPYRPKFIDETTAQFRDEVALQIGDKKNKHTLHLWFTTVYKYHNNKWQMVLFHGSVPDAGSSSADTFHVGEAEKKLKELELVVAQRTFDLQVKNKELEIETALEKVRSVAMGMKKPEDLLRICEVMFRELKKLGFADLRNAMININDDAKEEVINYDYSGIGGKTTTFFKYGSHPIVDNLIHDAKQSRETFTEVIYSGKKLQEWRKFRKANGEKDDAQLKSTDALYYYFYSTGSGATGISKFAKAAPKQLEIIKRFRNVFDLTYKRYVDITKAEEQTREAQIEAALERVRSRSLAMHKSDELKEVIRLVLTEIRKLDILAEHAGFYIDYKMHDDMHIWLADPNIEPFFAILPYFDTPTWNSFKKAKAKGTTFHADLLDFKEKNKFYKTLFKLFTIPEEAKQFYLQCKGLAVSTVLLDNVGLYIENFSGIPYSDEENKVLIRFGKVFQQTYTRFLDLQKAEAQAREAKIEAALERVRARTMAMQKSDELLDTSFVLFEQLKTLGEDSDQLSIAMFDDDNHAIRLYATTHGSQWKRGAKIELRAHSIYRQIHTAWKNKLKSYLIEISGKKLEALNQFKLNNPDYQVSMEDLPKERWLLYCANFSNGCISIGTSVPRPEQTLHLLARFAQVFDLTYTRFLDLQKAEAQSKEAQIQLAMERVRARTMAMQRSDELAEVASLMFQQVKSLGVSQWVCGFCIWEIGDTESVWYSGTPDGKINPPARFPLTEHPVFVAMDESRRRGDELFIYEKSGELQVDHYRYMMSLPVLSDLMQNYFDAGLSIPPFQIDHYANFSHGNLIFITYEHVPEMHDIFKRFAKVFEQTYTRFLDLQKAEAQAREAQIQLALERARAQSMMMQHSSELDNTLRVFHEQVLQLGIPSAFSFLWLPDEEKDRHIFWAAWEENNEFKSKAINYPLVRNEPATAQCLVDWKSNEPVIAYHVPPSGVEQYFAVWSELITGVEHLQAKYFNEGLYYVEAFMKYGCFGVLVKKDLNGDDKKTLERFAIEFERAYTRFLDLQKAEAQAREAQIEASLEKVRTVALTMRKSDEMLGIAQALYEQLIELGFSNIRNAIIDLHNNKEETFWDYDYSHEMGGTVTLMSFYEDPIIEKQVRITESDNDAFFELILEGEDLQYLIDMRIRNGEKEDPRLLKIKQLTYNLYSFGDGSIGISNFGLLNDEHKQILKRFRNVFEFAYKRHKDMANAEAQAREAQIEASLERVRGKAMAMHSSKDLADTIIILYQQIISLSITPRRCGVCLMHKETKTAELSNMNTNEDGQSFNAIGKLNLSGHPVLEGVYENWLLQKEYHPVLQDDNLRAYYKQVRKQMPSYPEYLHDEIQYGYFFYFPEGSLYAWTKDELPEADLQIYRRFTSVLSLTYKRYLDLQTAEANTREVVKQAALDRIRADIASMRTIGDLDRITPLIWNELTVLAIPFIRCGVFVMDDRAQLIHTFLSTPDGKAIAAFHLPYNTPGNIQKIISSWKEKKIYMDHWKDKEFTQFAEMLVQQGAMRSTTAYLQAIPKGGFYLHFLPFLQGMLYVGNTIQFSDDDINLLQAVAGAFSTAYARYEDFNKLEAAKKQVDSTLAELQTTQNQLIQSEKMASLGELTAGIAHEIQNPLNFVNNFSEVSKELLDEMKEAIERGETDDAKEIMNDVIQNLEKINHHGKRADGIVKGMLQHSRTGSGQKESTDINALCDEYLRLSYHGLRAKDKSFNAKFEASFDETLPKINVVPQDIGRVILNLINNAFYAASLNPSKGGTLEPENNKTPTVWVSTSQIPPSEGGGAKVLITVKDNGPGIPKDIIDKIFQPFFTTKPTGSGTGLGLSLSYDIVKAHGGELYIGASAERVDTKESEGAVFIISLPL